MISSTARASLSLTARLLLPAVAPAAPLAASSPAVPAGDNITDDEFEALLDQLHGKGKFVPPAEAAEPANAQASVSVAKPAATSTKPEPAKPAASKPAVAPVPAAAAPAAARAAAPAAADKPASEAETTVRVDTARLDEIMNMVGELVLVRNRLKRLG